MKVGFGLASEAERTNSAWKIALEDSKKAAPYQVRVHIYQGKQLLYVFGVCLWLLCCCLFLHDWLLEAVRCCTF